MSTVYTLSALLHLSDLQLRGLLSGPGTIWIAASRARIERRDALLNLENICRVLAQRRAQPRPPGF